MRPPAAQAEPGDPTPGSVASEAVIQLEFELVPKVRAGVLKDVVPGGARALERALENYDLVVRATNAVGADLDRVEAPVDLPRQFPSAAIPLSREQQAILRNEELNVQDAPLPTIPTTNRRQQAAAILIAIIALLTSLVQLLR